MTVIPFPLGVLDQSPIPEGSTGPDALRNTIDLAQLAERLGYTRYWVAEHHCGAVPAGARPGAGHRSADDVRAAARPSRAVARRLPAADGRAARLPERRAPGRLPV